MNYEEYYNGLLGELERANIVLTEYEDLEPHFINSTRNKVTYESYILTSMPIAIVDIAYILTSGNMSIIYNNELRNTLKNNTRLVYAKGFCDVFKKERTKIIEIFKSLVEISNDVLLNDLLNKITIDIDKNELRLERLRKLMRSN